MGNGIILEQEKVRKDIEALKYQKQQQNLAQLAMSQSSTFHGGMNGFYANQNGDDLKLKQREFDLNKLENELAAKQMNLDKMSNELSNERSALNKKKIEIELKEKELADAIFKYNQNQKEMQNEQKLNQMKVQMNINSNNQNYENNLLKLQNEQKNLR